jgi:hypothetical protein
MLRRFGKAQSWREIGAIDGYEHGAVHKGVMALIAMLPGRWTDVFGNDRSGRRLEEALPIEQILRAVPNPPRDRN